MAFHANTNWEFQTGGNNANGGGFRSDSGGTDYPLANTTFSYTDAVVQAVTTDCASALRAFVAADVGNIFNVTSGGTVQRAQIISVAAGVATFDKSMGTATNTCVGTLGGALAVPTDALLELSVAGNTWWLKGAVTYTLTGSVDMTAAGTTANNVVIAGYNTTRGDNPALANRPTITCAANTFYVGTSWTTKNLIITGTAISAILVRIQNTTKNCKVTNSSASAGRNAINSTDSRSMVFWCEAISTNGNGIKLASGSASQCHVHNSATGIYVDSSPTTIVNNIVNACSSVAVDLQVNGNVFIYGNTLYGAETPIGTGISGATSPTQKIIQNIIYGFVTGINITTAYTDHVIDLNDFYNNTADVANVTKGPNDIALNPQFVTVGNQGSDLCTNGILWTGATGATPPTGWAVKTAGTFTITAGGQAGDYCRIAHNGTNANPEISFAITTTVGKSYAITYYAQKGTATNATAKVGTTSGGTELGITKTHADVDWNTQKVITFEATATTIYFSVGATTSTSAQYSMIDTVTIYEQGEDFTPGANMKLTIDWTKMGL